MCFCTGSCINKWRQYHFIFSDWGWPSLTGSYTDKCDKEYRKQTKLKWNAINVQILYQILLISALNVGPRSEDKMKKGKSFLTFVINVDVNCQRVPCFAQDVEYKLVRYFIICHGPGERYCGAGHAWVPGWLSGKFIRACTENLVNWFWCKFYHCLLSWGQWYDGPDITFSCV